MSTEKPEVSSTVRDLAEKSVEQARSAVATLLEAAEKASDSIQSATKTAELPHGQAVVKGFGYAKQNISAIFDFATKLVQAPSLKDAAQMQADFVKEQSEIMSKQVEELKALGDKKDEKAQS